MKIPKISLGSWAFSFGPFENAPWTFSEVSRYCAETGFDGIEINGFRPHPHPDDFDTPSKCTELKNELENFGLGMFQALLQPYLNKEYKCTTELVRQTTNKHRTNRQTNKLTTKKITRQANQPTNKQTHTNQQTNKQVYKQAN